MEKMSFSFTWQGLLYTLLMVAAIVAIVLLIVLIRRLICLVGKVDLLVDNTRTTIECTVHKMPIIAQSMEDAVEDLQSVTSGVSNVFHIFRKFGGK